MGLIEDYRAVVVGDLFKMDSMADVWPNAGPSLRSTLPAHGVGAQNVVNLGNHLSHVFRAQHQETGQPTTQSQQQANAARGGAFWEGLVVWYLNLCLAGTRAVAVKKRIHTPVSINEALTVNLSNSEKLSEPDVVIIHLDSAALDEHVAGSPVRNYRALVDANFSSAQVFNLQCKSNWNDAIQSPMLWNLLYTAARMSTGAASMNVLGAGSLTFGSNGHYLQGLAAFRYGFATVPTNDLAGYSSTSSAVARGQTFSGGYFWGHPSSPGICRSLAEFFNVNSALLPQLNSIGVATANSLNGASVAGANFSYFQL